MGKNIALLFVLLTSLWIWRIFTSNFFLGLIILVAVISYYLAIQKSAKPIFYFALLAVLLFIQFKTTPPSPLTHLSDDDIRIQQERLNEYPPTHLTIIGKTIWFKFAHWFEEKPGATAVFRMEKNFFQAIDPSLYFFVNHPRERVGINEFEKLPYVYLPFFILGLVNILQKRQKLTLISLFTPILLLTIIGNSNPLSNFCLLPILIVATAIGLKIYFDYINRFKYANLFKFSSLFIMLLVFAQTLILNAQK